MKKAQAGLCGYILGIDGTLSSRRIIDCEMHQKVAFPVQMARKLMVLIPLARQKKKLHLQMAQTMG